MCRPPFDALDRSWAALTRSSDATAALCRWREDQHLDAPDLDALVQRTWRASKPDADRTCAALARRAGTDAAAARTLLQILRPGLRSLGRRLTLGRSFEDVDQELVALAWERIRTYPIQRRPASIARPASPGQHRPAGILLDVRKHYVRAVLDPEGRSTPLDDLPPDQPAALSAEHEAIDADLPSHRPAHVRLAAAVDRARSRRPAPQWCGGRGSNKTAMTRSRPSSASGCGRCSGAGSGPNASSLAPAERRAPGSGGRRRAWVATRN